MNRYKAAFAYLRNAAPFYQWRIIRTPCPLCESRYFIALRHDPFMTRCLSCKANLVNLSLIPVIKQHLQTHNVTDVWEMSTYGATLQFLQHSVANVSATEYDERYESGRVVDGVLYQDAQNTSFADGSLDLITSNQVFEHVEDDLRGFAECYRVLRPGGALILSVPLYDIPATQQLVDRENGELVFLCEPEYHGSRVSGPNSVLTFWRHSIHDICARIARCGFSARLVEYKTGSRHIDSAWIIYATRS